MKHFLGLFLLLFIWSCAETKIEYPKAAKGDVVDNYHGTDIVDPYRWMEDLNSEETHKWIADENKITQNYLSQIPFRDKIKNRLTDLYNYERYSAPSKHGENYYYYKNDGLQNFSVLYSQKGLDGEPSVFLDPNTFSEDGSISLAGVSFAKNNKYASYSISKGGSDWREVFVMDVDKKEKLTDHVEWVKFSGMSWYKDGFYYSRYNATTEEEKLKAANEFQKLYYHKVGTDQSQDKLVMESKNNPKRGFSGAVTDDEKFLFITGWEGSSEDNLLFYKDLRNNSKIKTLIGKLEAEYSFVDNIGNDFLVKTNFEAPNYKIVLINPKKPEKKYWKTIIPENLNPIKSVSFVNNKLIVSYLKDANTKVSVHDVSGKLIHE